MERLKPCPFCGSNEVYVYVKTGDYGEYFEAECLECESSTKYTDTRQEAIEAWNGRAEDVS